MNNFFFDINKTKPNREQEKSTHKKKSINLRLKVQNTSKAGGNDRLPKEMELCNFFMKCNPVRCFVPISKNKSERYAT